MECTNLEDLFDFLRTCDKKIYLWGAGTIGTILGQQLNDKDICWYGYYDTFCTDRTIRGKPVFKGIDFIPDFSAIYVISARDYGDIKQKLYEKGIKDKHIIWFSTPKVIDDIFNSAINDSKILDRIKDFRNIHHGKECFIVGNGPSLRLQDVERVGKGGYIALTSNFFYQCYDKTDYRSEYHFFVDQPIISKLANERSLLLQLLSNCHNLFTNAESDFNKYYSDPKMRNLVFFKKKRSTPKTKPKFSDNCFEGVYVGGTVTYCMLQIAVYMGFKTIYLLGMDNTSSVEILPNGNVLRHSVVQDHANFLGEYYMSWTPSPLYLAGYAFETTKHYCQAHGINVYNATRGGKLEVFPRVNLDDVLG